MMRIDHKQVMGTWLFRWEKLTVKSQQAMAQAQTGNGTRQSGSAAVHLLLRSLKPRGCDSLSVADRRSIGKLEHELHQIRGELLAWLGAEPARCQQALKRRWSRHFAKPPNFKDEYISTEHLTGAGI